MSDRAAAIFVHLATAALAVLAFAFVSRFGSHIPIGDEWDLLTERLSADSVPAWLFAHHNEHRYPLTKLLWLGGLRLTGFAFKPMLFIPPALLLGATLMFLAATRSIRGRQSPADALVPALLLHWGHGFNWLMAYQLGFALVAWAAAGWLWAAAKWNATGSRRWAAASVFFALALVPCGGFGIAFTPFVSLWCGFVWRKCRGIIGNAALILGLLACAYTAFVALTMPKTDRPVQSPAELVSAAAGYLSVAVGMWPTIFATAIRIAVAVLVMSLYLVAIAKFVRRRGEPAAAAAGLIVLATLLTAAATAYARGAGYADRMADASDAGLCAAWVLATSTAPRRPFMEWAAALIVPAAIVWLNLAPGRDFAHNLRHTAYRIERDLRACGPPLVLAGQYGHSLPIQTGSRFHDSLLKLKAAKIRPYSELRDDPKFTVRPAALPTRLIAGEFALPPPPDAFALRLRIRDAHVVHHDRIVLGDSEAWLAPRVAECEVVLPAGGSVLIIGDGVESLTLESAEWMIRE
jgi:hypothetical protein